MKDVNDSLLLGEASDLCYENIKATVESLQEVGFIFHPEKLVLVRTQKVTLGFIIDSVTMTIRLTEERKGALYSYCDDLSTTNVSIRGLAQANGVVLSSF